MDYWAKASISLQATLGLKSPAVASHWLTKQIAVLVTWRQVNRCVHFDNGYVVVYSGSFSPPVAGVGAYWTERSFIKPTKGWIVVCMIADDFWQGWVSHADWWLQKQMEICDSWCVRAWSDVGGVVDLKALCLTWLFVTVGSVGGDPLLICSWFLTHSSQGYQKHCAFLLIVTCEEYTHKYLMNIVQTIISNSHKREQILSKQTQVYLFQYQKQNRKRWLSKVGSGLKSYDQHIDHEGFLPQKHC